MTVSDEQASSFAEMHRILDEAMQGMVPADLREKGWRYVDMPGRWDHDAWNLILALLGDGEYQIIAMTSGTDKQGKNFRRGQFFISPQGLKNLGDKERYAGLSTRHSGEAKTA